MSRNSVGIEENYLIEDIQDELNEELMVRAIALMKRSQNLSKQTHNLGNKSISMKKGLEKDVLRAIKLMKDFRKYSTLDSANDETLREDIYQELIYLSNKLKELDKSQNFEEIEFIQKKLKAFDDEDFAKQLSRAFKIKDIKREIDSLNAILLMLHKSALEDIRDYYKRK